MLIKLIHRGAGYHHDVSPGKLCDKIEQWRSMREEENLVDEPEIIDLYLNKKDFVVNKMVLRLSLIHI